MKKALSSLSLFEGEENKAGKERALALSHPDGHYLQDSSYWTTGPHLKQLRLQWQSKPLVLFKATHKEQVLPGPGLQALSLQQAPLHLRSEASKGQFSLHSGIYRRLSGCPGMAYSLSV